MVSRYIAMRYMRDSGHTDGDDGADPLTKLLSTAPNCSILPREPQIHWPTARLTLAILTALAVIGWLIWRMM